VISTPRRFFSSSVFHTVAAPLHGLGNPSTHTAESVEGGGGAHGCAQLYREPERDSARRKAEVAFRMARRSALFFRDPYGVTWALDQHD